MSNGTVPVASQNNLESLAACHLAPRKIPASVFVADLNPLPRPPSTLVEQLDQSHPRDQSQENPRPTETGIDWCTAVWSRPGQEMTADYGHTQICSLYRDRWILRQT